MQVRDLTITRPDGAALLGPLDLDLPPGGRLAVVGESGSGKSLLVRALMGALEPNLIPGGLLRVPAKLAWVPQGAGPALHPFLSVSDHVSLLAAMRLGLAPADALRLALPWMERLGLETRTDFLARRPASLSGGERQRVVLVQAVACRPDLLLLDEPTAALDPAGMRAVEAALEILPKHTSWIWVTHDLSQAARVAQEVLVLYGGRAQERRKAAAPLRHPYALRLLRAAEGVSDPDSGFLEAPGRRGPGCVFAPRCLVGSLRCQSEAPPWAEDADGGLACWTQAGGAGGENRSRPAALAM